MTESVENAINEFYKLKNKYETDILKNKKTIINNNSLSSKEKKNEFNKLKPKCVNCKKPGGTLFSIKYYPSKDGNEDYKEFKAKCGVILNPCNLNITIRVGKYEVLPDTLEYIEGEIKEKKNEIINDKNKLLFGLITSETAIKKFEDLREYINELNSLLESYLEEYHNIVNNTEKLNELKINIEKSYFYIDQIKSSIQQMNDEDNVQYANDAVSIYVNELKPILKQILEQKYKQNIVHFNENDNTYHLIQNKYTVDALEFSFFKDTVVNYDVGLKIINNNNNISTAAEVLPSENLADKPLIKKPRTIRIIDSSSSDENI